MAAVPPGLATALQDRYRLDRELGQGGMATVYLAHDLKHDRDVALKVLRPELAAVLGAERFLREIQLTAKLQHPHIVTLIDSGEAGGSLFYVLPYVAGESLRDRMTREGQLPLEEVLRLTRAVAGALHYAHEQGIIHRDIKPENILVSHGEPMVADFGIALAAAKAGRERLTETGLSLGTPAYMSPEQATAEHRLDGRSDQYSLACVVYEMLAGEPPYSGATAQAIIAKRLSEPVPKLGTLREVPAAVEVAVSRALGKRPADRFGTVGEFAAALERPASRARRRLTPRMAGLLGGVGTVAVVAVLGWLLRPALPPRPMVTRQLTLTGLACCPSLSPDGQWVAFFTGDSVMTQEVSGGRAIPIARGTSLYEPQWSTDGKRVLIPIQIDSPSAPGYYAVPRLGGTVQRLGDAAWGAWSVIASDGRTALESPVYTDSITVLDLASGSRTRSLRTGPGSFTAWRNPLSPDGRWIAFGGEAEGKPFLGILATDGSIRRRLVDWVDRGAIRWNPRGDAIYFEQRVPGGRDLMKVRIDPQTGERRSDPLRVWSHAPFSEYSLANDGRTLAYQLDHSTSRIWAIEIEGPSGKARVSSRELTAGTGNPGTPDITPDGNRVAYVEDEGLARNIHVVSFAGGPERLVGSTRSDRIPPRWSPDGKRLVFVPPDSSVPGLIVAEVESAQLRRIGGHYLRPNFWDPAWSASGERILYATEDPRRYSLLDLRTSHETLLSLPDSVGWLYSARFSPDDRELVVAAFARGGTQFWRLRLVDGRWTSLGAAAASVGFSFPKVLLWTRDGWIYYEGPGGTVWRITADGTTTERYAIFPALPGGGWWSSCRLSRDARRAVCTGSQSESDIWIATDFDPEVRQ